MQKREEMQRVIKGKKEAYALLGTKPSGTHQRSVRRRGRDRESCFGDYKGLPKSFRRITSKVKRDNEKYGEVRAGD